MTTCPVSKIGIDKNGKSTIIYRILVVSIVFLIGASFSHAEVVGIWLFDEEDGKIVTDASGNGHDGEIIGTQNDDRTGDSGGRLSFFRMPTLNLVRYAGICYNPARRRPRSPRI